MLEMEIGGVIRKHPDMIKNVQLAPYQHYLENLVIKESYRLSVPEEEIIHEITQYGTLEWRNLQNKWRNTRKIESPLEDRTIAVPWGEMLEYLTTPDREIRRRAIENSLNELIKNESLFATCMRNIYSSHAAETKRRGYQSPLQPTLVLDEVPQESLTSLLSSIDEHIFLYQDYLKIKAKVLGLKKLSGEDVSDLPVLAPLPKSEMKLFSWEETAVAVKLTLPSI